MFVGTPTQSTKSASTQFSLRAYKLFYQAICDFNLLTRAATHGNDSQPTWEFIASIMDLKGFTKFYLPIGAGDRNRTHNLLICSTVLTY